LFIFALRDKIHVNLDDFLKARFTWEKRVITLKNALKDLKEQVEYDNRSNDGEHSDLKDDLEKETEKISDVLEEIKDWQKHYQPYLNGLEKEQEGIDNALKGDSRGKKGKR
jgi:DNA-binding transcriptional regulator GbsR (MarR family)